MDSLLESLVMVPVRQDDPTAAIGAYCERGQIAQLAGRTAIQ